MNTRDFLNNLCSFLSVICLLPHSCTSLCAKRKQKSAGGLEAVSQLHHKFYSLWSIKHFYVSIYLSNMLLPQTGKLWSCVYDIVSKEKIMRRHLQHSSHENFNKTNNLTHCKLFSNPIGCLFTRSLLCLQLDQEAPQYPRLFHGLLHSTLPGMGNLSQACQDTKVLAHQS